MDTKKEKCIYILFILKEKIAISDITNIILNLYISFDSYLTIMINGRVISFMFDICRKTLLELKTYISTTYKKGTNVNELYAQYGNIKRHNREINYIRYGYILLLNNDDLLMNYLDDSYHLAI